MDNLTAEPLDSGLATGYNGDMDKQTLIEYLTSLVTESGSQRNAAQRLGVSQQYLNDILSGRREPGDKVLDALEMERVVTYREKERVP